ncbi:MAG: hypothetical protein AAGF95_21955 [Chloroflexota bacterium]
MLALLLTSAPAHATSTEKTRPDEPIATGGVINYRVSEDGQYAVYLTDQDQDQLYELYSLHLETGTAVQLATTQEPNSWNIQIEISTDNRYVVYRLGLSDDLFSVPITGGTSTKLNDEQQVVFPFQISPDNQYIVYLSNSPTSGWYSVPITGGASVRIGDTESLTQISSDGSYIVVATIKGQLYSIPVNGGTSTVLNEDLLPGFELGHANFRISPNGKQVVFIAAQGTGAVGLFNIPITGGTPVRISALPAEEASFIDPFFQISGDGNSVVYVLTQMGVKSELYKASLKGESPIRLQAAEGNAIKLYDISDDSAYIHYVIDHSTNDTQELYGVSSDGGIPFKVGQATVLGFAYTPDNQHIVYISDQEIPFFFDLYKASLDGKTSVKLNHSLSEGEAIVNSQITSDSKTMVYAVNNSSQPFSLFNEIYQASLTGGEPIKLVEKPANGNPITGLTVSPNSEFILYSVDRDGDGQDELYKRNLVSN